MTIFCKWPVPKLVIFEVLLYLFWKPYNLVNEKWNEIDNRFALIGAVPILLEVVLYQLSRRGNSHNSRPAFGRPRPTKLRYYTSA